MTHFYVNATQQQLSFRHNDTDYVFRCALGRHGFIAENEKREGDGKTPLGTYRLKTAYYRPDKLSNKLINMPPTTAGLAVQAIQPHDGWCDAPDDAHYNQPITLPYAASHEIFWRDDDVYDIVIAISHNDDPVIPHFGSCIFIHIAKPDYAPTAGCIALSRADIEILLLASTASSHITINA